MDALSRLCAKLEAEPHYLASTLEAVHEAGARLCQSQPFRFVRAVYGPDTTYPCAWPIAGKSTADVLADCRERLEIQRTLDRAGHWAFDGSRLRALIPAEMALSRMVAAAAVRVAA